MKTAIGSALGPVNGLVTAMEPLTPMIGLMAAQLLPQLISKIKLTGSTAATAAIGVGSFFGAFFLAEALLRMVPEQLRGIVGGLTALTAAVVAATVAWMAYHGTMTLGTAVPVILAAVATGIAGIHAAIGMAKGGIVREPTLAVIGEEGPEAVVPLDRAGSFGETRQNIVIYPTINIENISKDFTLEDVHEVIVDGLGDGVNKYIAEKYRRRI